MSYKVLWEVKTVHVKTFQDLEDAKKFCILIEAKHIRSNPELLDTKTNKRYAVSKTPSGKLRHKYHSIDYHRLPSNAEMFILSILD